VHGWSSPLVVGAGTAGLVVLASFFVWERTRRHPMLNLGYFRERSFSGAVVSVGLVMFGLFGALFVLTQFLQFQLGYTPLQAGLRTLPAAGAIVVVAPASSLFVRWLSTKLTVTGGLLVVAAGLWQISGASVTSAYTDVLPGMVMLGVGAGMVIPAATGSVMGSVPAEHTGVGSATNGAFLQVGGALGVAVIGSLLSTRYQHRMTSALAPYHVPGSVENTILGSVGGALHVAHQVGGSTGALLAGAARSAFLSGMDLALTVGAIVALVAALLALFAIPAKRPRRARDRHRP
jgi:hypothetical protein